MTDDNGAKWLSPTEQVYALKTWRYLRVAMAGLPLALFAAIVEDRFADAGHCVQGSISAYYYTPVHSFFIGALVTIGVCLYCLKGATPGEDVFMNLAGMFAPVVALVPTDPPRSCTSSSVFVDRFPSARNNIFALAVLETIAFVFIAVLMRRSVPSPRPPHAQPTSADRNGYFGALAILGVEWILWGISASGTHVLTKVVHYSSAILMFACIFIVVCLHARNLRKGLTLKEHLQRPQTDEGIAIGMVVSVAVFIVVAIMGWNYSVLFIEVALITLFMMFWIGQTAQNWHREFPAAADTRRPDDDSTPVDKTGANVVPTTAR